MPVMLALARVSGEKLAEAIGHRSKAFDGADAADCSGFYDEIIRKINAYYTRKYGKVEELLIVYFRHKHRTSGRRSILLQSTN